MPPTTVPSWGGVACHSHFDFSMEVVKPCLHTCTDFPSNPFSSRAWAQHHIKIRTSHLEGHAALLMDWGIHTHQLKWSLLSASLIHSSPLLPLHTHCKFSSLHCFISCLLLSDFLCKTAGQTGICTCQASLNYMAKEIKVHNPNLNLPHLCSWLALGCRHCRLQPGFFKEWKPMDTSPFLQAHLPFPWGLLQASHPGSTQGASF